MGRFVGVVTADNVIVGPGASTVACDGPVDAGSFHHNNAFSGPASPYDGCPAFTGTDGNISSDPLFVVATGPTPDYRLQADSTSIDAGDPTLPVPLTDLAGLPRVTDGDGDGAAAVDMGAYEAAAMAAKIQRMPYTVWTQPTGVPLDGLGGWVYPVVDPTAAEGQLAPNYLYAEYFSFVAGPAIGQVGLVTGPDGKFAVFSVVENLGTALNVSVPFEWSANRFYFPLVYQLGPGSWGAWVYDDAAATWTAIGTLTLPAEWGKLAPASVTAAPGIGASTGNCSRYPRADVLMYAPFGFVGGTGSVAAATTTDSGPGDCVPEASVAGLWARYRAGADVSGPG